MQDKTNNNSTKPNYFLKQNARLGKVYFSIISDILACKWKVTYCAFQKIHRLRIENALYQLLYIHSKCILPSWAKLNRVPDGDVKLEPVEKGELLAESCNPLPECERSQSRASSWRRCDEGVYLQQEDHPIRYRHSNVTVIWNLTNQRNFSTCKVSL